MDLGAIIIPEGLEVRPTITTCTIEGSLEEEDLRQLLVDPATLPNEDDPSDLKKIREKHHHVARLLADGLSQRLVSQICGYSEAYLSVLLNNPSMQELIELYRIQNGKATQLVVEKMKTVGLKALEQLDEALDDKKLNNQELLSAAKLGLDRAGHGPTSTQKIAAETHVFDHAKLAELSANARRENVKYIVPQEEIRESLKKLPPPAEHPEP